MCLFQCEGYTLVNHYTEHNEHLCGLPCCIEPPCHVTCHLLCFLSASVGTFSPVTLTVFFVLCFLLAGLFVSSLLCGGAFGHLVANLLNINLGIDIYSGTFALLGAAAFLEGVVWMTISLTVILIESTNEITYSLPIMTTLMVKWTGDFCNKGIYDVHIHLRRVPMLEWEMEMDKLTASDIMEPNPTYVYPYTRIRSLVSILCTTVYHAFPVVTENRDDEHKFMKGNILNSNNIRFKNTYAGEQRWRCQSMKPYPSSELRKVCDDQADMLQQMLERRYMDNCFFWGVPIWPTGGFKASHWTIDSISVPGFIHIIG
uniref:Uncharacterized protein n=1 Tax=Oncorhynchus kisutch TaxID=8019 RepID=A0A8C7HVS5_ONCKI